MEQNIIKVKGTHGGARANAGRPKGSTNKISAQELIDTAETIIGKPFIVSLLEGYHETILEGDRKTRVIYEKMIMDKVLGDKSEVEIVNPEDAIEARAQAFAEALAALATKDNK
jgi:hypothetical protein